MGNVEHSIEKILNDVHEAGNPNVLDPQSVRRVLERHAASWDRKPRQEWESNFCAADAERNRTAEFVAYEINGDSAAFVAGRAEMETLIEFADQHGPRLVTALSREALRFSLTSRVVVPLAEAVSWAKAGDQSVPVHKLTKLFKRWFGTPVNESERRVTSNQRGEHALRPPSSSSRLTIEISPYMPASGDPLRPEHLFIAKCVEDQFRSESEPTASVRPTETSNEWSFREADPEQCRRYILAAVTQARHWDGMMDRVMEQAESQHERLNAFRLPGWRDVRDRRRIIDRIVRSLLDRQPPLKLQDLLAILAWCNAGKVLTSAHFPLESIYQAIRRYSDHSPIDDELRESIQQVVSRLKSSPDKETSLFGATVEEVL